MLAVSGTCVTAGTQKLYQTYISNRLCVGEEAISVMAEGSNSVIFEASDNNWKVKVRIQKIVISNGWNTSAHAYLRLEVKHNGSNQAVSVILWILTQDEKIACSIMGGGTSCGWNI